jgi:hypothetical protein
MSVAATERPANKECVMEVFLKHNWTQNSMDVIVSFMLRPLLPVAQTAIFFLYEGAGLRPLACWGCRFESCQRAWMLFCCGCCVLSGRGLSDDLINRPEESYRLWCVVVCDLETTRMRTPWSALGPAPHGGGGLKKIFLMFVPCINDD